ncbi:hypothetical protein EV426DRAFT_700579 [Tirmania nivea]|nr:hypothetical protein EV426DRAFT_700579 [Tirmania nivea]
MKVKVMEARRKEIPYLILLFLPAGSQWLQMADRGVEFRRNKMKSVGDLEATCRSCGKYEESESHVALVCCEGEWMGRRFGSWEDIDRVKELVRKEMVDGKEVPVDLAEVFFSRLRSC